MAISLREQQEARRRAFKAVFGKDLEVSTETPKPMADKPLSGQDALAYRDGVAKARAAADSGQYAGLAALLKDAVKSKDKLLEQATFDVLADLDKEQPTMDWYGGVQFALEHPERMKPQPG
jgi:hypothetical protein